MSEARIFNMDCMEGMTSLEDHSLDCIICDLPYGVLNKQNPHAKWDTELPLDELWQHYRRLIKPNGAIILFCQGMFTARLMISNPKMWRYNLIWKKGTRSSGFLNANRMPLRNHEDIAVFYQKLPVYHPQMAIGEKNHGRNVRGAQSNNKCYGNFKVVDTVFTNEKYPLSVIDIPKEHDSFYHPTQKPVALLEYLIRTYTDEGDTVMDNCMGSGTTGVACMKTGRNFIGYEKEKKYFDISQERIFAEKERINKKSKLIQGDLFKP